MLLRGASRFLIGEMARDSDKSSAIAKARIVFEELK
jgi:hypothetical protein